MSAAAPESAERPPRPTSRLPAGSIWPLEYGRQILRDLEQETPVRLHEVVGRQGREEGSGSSDLVVERVGDWCWKTSPRRRYRSEDEGRLAAHGIVQRKLVIEELLPPKTALALVPDEEGGAWLWTISPWMTTLRRSLADAEASGDEEKIATALEAFGRVAMRSIDIAARRSLRIDLNPSNFGWYRGVLRYLDDDLESGSNLPAFGHAILRRVEEYRSWPAAVERYIETLVHGLGTSVDRETARTTMLWSSIEAVHPRSPEAGEARERLLGALARRFRRT